VIGTGGTDQFGNFQSGGVGGIPVSPALQEGDKICPYDKCGPAGGDPILVRAQAAAPASSPLLLAFMAAALGILGLLGLGRLRARTRTF